MILAVFHEFIKPDVLTKVNEFLPVDCPSTPTNGIKSDEELNIVQTNAKLFLHHPVDQIQSLSSPEFTEEQINDVLNKLNLLGFEVLIRHPVSSTGFKLSDRIILKYKV